MSEPLKIAVAGLGTVGAGILKLLSEHGDLLEGRCGRKIQVTAVSARDQGKDRGVSLDGLEFYEDAARMAREADADVIVELIGGADGIARETVEAAIDASRHVVTANKALIAHHGTELALKAETAGVSLAYEAAVAGGIPIIKALREGLVANGIQSIHGILNGTCNYILSRMRDEGLEFTEVLEDAQRLGYAEADPEFDIEGVDAAHKLAILASLAFGRKANFDDVHVEGITRISQMDIRFAEELGYRVKLLGIASQSDHGIEQRVHPCLVPTAAPIASVEGVFNAVVAEGDFVDTLMMEGRGAGEGPTASAVCADLADIARGILIPAFGIPAKDLKSSTTVSMDAHKGAYYIRLMVIDRPGIFADVATTLRDNEVSMESILQHGRGAPGEAVPVVLTLHETEEARASAVIETIANLDGVLEAPVMIRIENL
ncbi:MAG: homoserine dehydrogenase [Rhodospirillaceae bacterium]|jgi:homoserine dehydrogenase|nr:homoserine dehydrogenase [Rhodospirillaceae bacterium]MBT5245922.1 homoserine dehydrogenase [Rhodospirillaceae bacterium]MBT5561847.1 homoserine dehydrogenase [Rhodospirillaceae bacterium]MBT6240961.1 homoserine dehydrogenase [Rhodospirillaceae bacterium]MBT7138140.1 homoserine dehydrogenase [Rhodospirillaceae bacterium]